MILADKGILWSCSHWLVTNGTARAVGCGLPVEMGWPCVRTGHIWVFLSMKSRYGCFKTLHSLATATVGQLVPFPDLSGSPADKCPNCVIPKAFSFSLSLFWGLWC